jgi:NAD(P)-dependent dehydrogenase (short-subunit alcohol dehydrogenase family)
MGDIAVVVGVGARRGLGAALARRFAAEGLHVIAAGRTPAHLAALAVEITACGGQISTYPLDVTDEEAVKALFSSLPPTGPTTRLALVVYNVGANVLRPFQSIDTETFTDCWRLNCLGGFLVAQEAIRRMVPQGSGTLLFTGATASLRARPPFTAFASAKAALRAVAHGLAREFGPLNIHVAHVVLDGVIDGEQAERIAPDLVKSRGPAGLLQPDEIAQVYWSLHCQHPNAWTHEMEIRPFGEVF